jgi:rRNA maturation protein Nop10
MQATTFWHSINKVQEEGYLTLKMEAQLSSETSGSTHPTTLGQVLEEVDWGTSSLETNNVTLQLCFWSLYKEFMLDGGIAPPILNLDTRWVHQRPGRCTPVKDKVHPRTDHEGPEGEYRYSYTLSLTSALDGGEWSTPRPGRFTPGKETRYPLYRRLCGPQRRSGRLRKISPSPGIDSRTVQPVARRYTNWATPAQAQPLLSSPNLNFSC